MLTRRQAECLAVAPRLCPWPLTPAPDGAGSSDDQRAQLAAGREITQLGSIESPAPLKHRAFSSAGREGRQGGSRGKPKPEKEATRMSLGGLSAPDANAAGRHWDICLLKPGQSPQPRQPTYRTVRYARWPFYVCGTLL